MANEHLFVPKLAAVTIGAAQPDPDASLGGLRSSTTVADVVSTFTGVNSDREVVDSTQIAAPDRTGSWIVFLDTNLNEAREVIAFDGGTGTFEFSEALPATPLVADRYWLFTPNGLFSAFDADLCRRRATRHRLVYAHNLTGAVLNDVRIYVRALEAGPVECRVAMGVATFPQSTDFDVADLADEEEVPAADVASGFQKLSAAGPVIQEFKRLTSWSDAANQGSPYGTGGASAQCTISSTRERPIWVQLRFPADAPIPRAARSVFQVFIDANGATVSSFLVVVQLEGVVEDIAGVVDRRLRLNGGARLSCRVRDSVAPFEFIPGATISIELLSGPGSMEAQVGSVQEDDSTPIRRVYLSPTDPAEVGETVQFRFEVT